MKFSQPGTAVTLGSSSMAHAMSLWVRDEGVGVAPEDHERILDRFVRADGGTAEGSGLGLAIVKAIAQAHSGTVACESIPGEGSTFTILLPPIPDAEVPA